MKHFLTSTCAALSPAPPCMGAHLPLHHNFPKYAWQWCCISSIYILPMFCLPLNECQLRKSRTLSPVHNCVFFTRNCACTGKVLTKHWTKKHKVVGINLGSTLNEIYMFIIFKMAPYFNNAIRSPLYREELRSTEVNRTFLRPHAAPAC